MVSALVHIHATALHTDLAAHNGVGAEALMLIADMAARLVLANAETSLTALERRQLSPEELQEEESRSKLEGNGSWKGHESGT